MADEEEDFRDKLESHEEFQSFISNINGVNQSLDSFGEVIEKILKFLPDKEVAVSETLNAMESKISLASDGLTHYLLQLGEDERHKGNVKYARYFYSACRKIYEKMGDRSAVAGVLWLESWTYPRVTSDYLIWKSVQIKREIREHINDKELEIEKRYIRDSKMMFGEVVDYYGK